MNSLEVVHSLINSPVFADKPAITWFAGWASFIAFFVLTQSRNCSLSMIQITPLIHRVGYVHVFGTSHELVFLSFFSLPVRKLVSI